MFENLTNKLSGAFKLLTGSARLSEDNISPALKQVKKALIEADVALSVVNSFIERVKGEAIGVEVTKELNPEQFFIKIVHEQLVHLMGDSNEELNLKAAPPAVVMVAGLQGSGKTTSVAKLAKFLKEKRGKKVLVASADVYRPAAILQLETLSKEVGVDFFPSDASQKPTDIANNTIEHAKKNFVDVVLLDTAGRLHIDTEMMAEVKALQQAVKPVETLFVVDAMTGQDAANTAKAFNDALGLTGVILTKTDGDARGGAALSVREITGKPIKFLGVGEKITALDPFHPERLASRILGMGDVLSLVEEIEQKVDKKKAEKLAKKITKGKTFDFNDLKDQLQQMKKMGGMASLLDKLPGMSQLPKEVKAQVQNEKVFVHMTALIDSMTPKERRFPAIIKGSRRKRIANGAGLELQDLNKLIKQFEKMQKMMKKFSKRGGLKNMMRGMGAMKGMPGMPPFE